MNYESMSKEELITELQELKKSFDSLNSVIDLERQEHVQIVNDLRKSEMRFRTMFEDAPIGVALIDSVSGKIYELNQMFADIAGRTMAEMANIDWISITHPDDIQMDLDQMSLLVSGEINGFQMEKRYLRPDGSVVWISMKISRLIKEPDMPIVHLCMIEDISERKNTVNLITESYNKYRTLYESLKDSIITTDLEGRIIDCNQACLDILGYTMAEIRDLTYQQLTPEKWRQVDEHVVQTQINVRGYSDEYEKEYIRKDGSVFPISLRFWLIKDKEGNPSRYWGIIRDITERKKSEELLRLSEENYRTLIDNIGEGVAFMDPNEQFKFANHSAERIFGVEAGKLEGAQLQDFISHEQYDFIQTETIKRSHGENSVYQLEISALTGETRTIVVTAVPFMDQNNLFLGTYGVFRDITVEKKAMEIQREIEALYHTTFELPLVGYAITSVDKGWIEINSAILKMLGYTRTELESLTWADITHPEDLNLDESQFMRIMTGEIETYSIEKRYIRKDGQEIPTSLSVGCVRNPDRSVNYFVALIQDISSRKQAEQALLESEEKYRIIFANNPNPMIIFDPETLRFLEVNQSAMDLYGYSREEFLAITILDIHPEEDKILVIENVRNMAQNENAVPDRKTWRHLKKDGEMIFVELTAHSITVAGRVARHVLINDITLQKRLEEALLSKTLLLEAQLNSVTEGILVVDQLNARILNNKRYEEIFQIPHHFFADQKHDTILNYIAGLNKDPEKFIERTNFLNNHPKEKSLDELDLANGQIIERYSAPVVGKEGEYYGRIWSFRDITELKNAELEIKYKNTVLQKTISDKDKFYSIIAHDLRGPISGIAGMTEMMADPLQAFSEVERNELMLELSESAQNTFNLLEQLLEWSRMESGIIEFKPQNLGLKDVVAESLKPLTKLAKEKGVELLVNIPNAAYVAADPNMLQTILRNLISNAIKYTMQGGTVTISVNPYEEKMVILSVRDTGIGMSPEIVENIFTSDYNIRRKGTKGEKSSGLGLLLCREFIEKHGGTLDISSEQGRGSDFRFTLPCSAQCGDIVVSEDSETVKPRESRLGKLKLLIVEDDLISAKLLTAMVRNLCSEMIVAKTGIEAIEMCRLHPDFDLILMDIQLPEIDGYEATRRIRQFNVDVVILAQTALATGANRAEALLNGCNDHISKPINVKELQTLIREYFN